MEEVSLKRDNLEELADTLKQLLGDTPFTFSYQDRRKPSGDALPPEKVFEQSSLFGDNPICWWTREQDDPHRKSTLRVAVKLPSGASRFLEIHPSVRCGGRRYDDNGHSTWFTVRPKQIEIRDGHAGFHYTFQVA